MHINSDRLIESLTEVELMHINSCSQCESERAKLIALKLSANQMEIIHPPKETWLALQNKLPNKQEKVSHFKRYVFSSAASLFFVAVGWLVWSNYSLQKQLEQVLLVNQTIESQLVQESMPTFHQAQLLSKIRVIDLQLINATTSKEKLKILKQRHKLMAEMVRNSKGKEYEYSI